MASALIIAREEVGGPEVEDLLAERDAYFDVLYAEKDRAARRMDLNQPGMMFFTARLAGRLVGCGALVAHDGYGELKRVFVRADARRSGIGGRLVEHLEAEARGMGMNLIRLEVGARQPQAWALYLRAGYRESGPFGTYRANPLSNFMEKALSGEGVGSPSWEAPPFRHRR